MLAVMKDEIQITLEEKFLSRKNVGKNDLEGEIDDLGNDTKCGLWKIRSEKLQW